MMVHRWLVLSSDKRKKKSTDEFQYDSLLYVVHQWSVTVTSVILHIHGICCLL
jgi:hypothetical protein